jgi:hypothetical protein
MSPLILALLTLSTIAVADPSTDGTELSQRHNTILKYTTLGSVVVREVYGPALRVQASLEVCELDKLAETVAPDTDAINELLLAYLAEQPDAEPYPFEILAAVKGSLEFYRFGYREGVSLMYESQEPDVQRAFCSAVVKMANAELAGTNPTAAD